MENIEHAKIADIILEHINKSDNPSGVYFADGLQEYLFKNKKVP